jgi:flagellin
MSSILTNTAATAALQTLRTINNSMDSTQNRVSSGLAVGSAADNAAYWSIATTMRSDNKALSAVNDALGIGAAKVDVAYSAVEASIDVVNEIKKKLVSAKEQGVDKAKVQEEITQLQNQLKSISESASFNGQNWVAAADGNVTVVTGFVRSTDTSGGTPTTGVSVKTETIAHGATNKLFGANTDGSLKDDEGILGTAGTNSNIVATLTINAGTADATLDGMISDVDEALNSMASVGSKLGSVSMRINLQEDFMSKLSDAIEKGVGRLVDADMNEESTRLKALQTQQQLAIQSLSIANSNSQNILSLFR